MNVATPGLLWVIPLCVGLLAASAWIRARRVEELKSYLSAKPKDSFWPPQTPQSTCKDRGVLRGILLIIATIGLLGALSGFSIGVREIQLRRSVAPVFLVMDISRSMSVQDVPWGRLEAAKLFVRRVASRLPGTSMGLTVFAGETHQLLPPGPDRDLLFTYIESLGPDLVTSQGTALEAVLAECARFAEEMKLEATPVFLLVSDGEDVSPPESLTPLAAAIRNAGGVLATVSFGTEEGGPVPTVPIWVGQSGPGTDGRSGPTSPHSSANPRLLRMLAEAGGGRFASARNPEEVAALLAWLEEALGETEIADSGREGVERWSWLILISILALGAEASLRGPLERPKVSPWA